MTHHAGSHEVGFGFGFGFWGLGFRFELALGLGLGFGFSFLLLSPMLSTVVTCIVDFALSCLYKPNPNL